MITRTLAVLLLATVLATLAPSPAMGADDVEVRRELEQQYQKLVDAYGRQDGKAIASTYAADFHAVYPHGQIIDVRVAKEMDLNTPVEARYTIRELTVSGNRLIAVAVVSREHKWMSKLAGAVRTVSTSKMMRQTWSRAGKHWKLKSTDLIWDEKRFVNGKRVDPDPTKLFDPDAPPYEPPAKEGVSVAISEEGATGTETIDKLLARALVTQLDAAAALYSSGIPIGKRRGYTQGPPGYLSTSAKEIAADLEELRALHSTDPIRERVRKRVLERLENHGKAVDLTIQAIQAAAAGGGWTSEANRLLDQSWVSYQAGPPVDSLEIRLFAASPTIRNALPRDALMFAGMAQDSCGYSLGIMAWVTMPMRVARVSRDSYSEKLGLQAGDEIVSMDGRAFESWVELKWALAALAGKRVDIVVKRDGGSITLNPKVPHFPAPIAEVRRELERRYQELVKGHGLQDQHAIPNMHTADFDAILSDGQIIDAQAMKERYEKSPQIPVEARYTIRELAASDDRLIAVVELSREMKWTSLLTGAHRTISTSEMTRHTWSKAGKDWKLKSVDNIRDEKRFVDGKRVDPDPTKPFEPEATPY